AEVRGAGSHRKHETRPGATCARRRTGGLGTIPSFRLRSMPLPGVGFRLSECGVGSGDATPRGRGRPRDPRSSRSQVTMKNPISMAVAGAYVWAVSAADELYAHATAWYGPWHLVTTAGAITKVTASQGTNYGLAIVGGKVYRLSGGITTPDEMPGLPGAPSDIAASAYYAYVLMPAGTWWWRPLVGSTAWVQLTGGDYPWALVGGALYYGK